MAMVQCEMRHFYDNRKHVYCPYCPVTGLKKIAARRYETRLGAIPGQTGSVWGNSAPAPDDVAGTESGAALIRVFISSTFHDLETYRQAALEAVHSLRGLAEDMRFWSADEREPPTLSVDRVKSCDLMILILAHRYGFVPPGSAYSIVELEYRAACEVGVPVLGFFVNPTTPWPPGDVEWDQKDNLDRFKKTVAREVTTRNFSSPDELNRLITQAVSNFRERHRENLQKKGHFSSRAITTTLPIKVKTEPDAILVIGTAEDGLPLLLDIRRDQNPLDDSDLLEMNNVFKIIRPSDPNKLVILFDNFLQQFRADARRHCAGNGVRDVRRRLSALEEEMYVMRSNMSDMASSVLSRLVLQCATTGTRPAAQDTMSVIPVTQPMTRGGGAKIQSRGGRNRYIAVSAADGGVYCAGEEEDSARGKSWVEWRPFLYESIAHHFPNAHYIIPTSESPAVVPCNSASYARTVLHHFANDVEENGCIYLDVRLLVARAAIARKMVDVAHAVAALHLQGRIHGDLKPQNILLTSPELALIDGFDIAEGERAPGWTPEWSAPEQVTGGKVFLAADIYPIGVMIAHILGGALVGEAQNYLTPDWPHGTRTHPVLRDPSLYITSASTVLTKEGAEAWGGLVEHCLKFDAGQRLNSAADLAGRLAQLIERHVPEGDIEIRASEIPLFAARLPDGSDSLARVITDQWPPIFR